MNNTTKEQTVPEHEISIWELLGLILKNWFRVVIIVVAVVGISIAYSYLTRSEVITTYTLTKQVIYDEWAYYPPTIGRTYAKSLKSYLSEQADVSSVPSVVLKDYSNNDDKYEYYMKATFPMLTSSEDVDQVYNHIVTWHNDMISDEVDRIKQVNEAELELLYAEYEKEERSYSKFLSTKNNASSYDLAEENALKAKRDVAYEVWKTRELAIQQVNSELANQSLYYIEKNGGVNVTRSSSASVTSNVIMAVIAGFIISIIYILLKESLINYRKRKELSQ